MRKYLWLSLLAALAVSLLAFVACSDDDDDEESTASPTASPEEIAAVEDVMSSILSTDPTDQAQVDFWLAHMSDDVLESFFGTTRDECAASAEECIGESTPADSFEGTEITGDSAQTTVTDGDGAVFTVRFVSETDTWVIREIRFGPAAVPAGVTAVDLQLNEFAFGFNRSEIEDGNVAFPFENTGEQAHEVVLLKTNAEYNVDTVVEFFVSQGGGNDLPPGVDSLNFLGIAGPGGGGIAALPEPLEAGSYTFICLFPDTSTEEQTPHASLGMVADFDVPAE